VKTKLGKPSATMRPGWLTGWRGCKNTAELETKIK